MNIVSQFYKNVLKNRIISKISNISLSLVNDIVDSIQSFDNNKYLNLINTIQHSTIDMIKTIIVETFEEIDLQYKFSSERKMKYEINKSNISRTLITIVGEITFSRTYYKSKFDKSYKFYIDDLFELPKYDHYDPIVKALAIDKAFSSNQVLAGKDTGELLTPISTLFSSSRNLFHISRQSVNNWINDWYVPNYIYNRVDTPSTLYIMADEKFLGCQDLNNDIMAKCFIAFEDVKKIGKNRNKLINKTIFSTYSSNSWDKFINVLSQKYDFSKINKIIILGDGASWIKSGISELKMEKCNNVEFRLCNFHFKQAINRMTTDKDIRKNLLNIFNQKSKDDFKFEVHNLIENNKNNEDKINKNLNYILNNYSSIKAMINSNIGSSMESHISHCIANLFASRPKGYSSQNINQYLKISNYKNNDLNILYLYSQTYNNDEIKTLNQSELNYSIFDKKGSNIPILDYGKAGTCNKIKSIIYS